MERVAVKIDEVLIAFNFDIPHFLLFLDNPLQNAIYRLAFGIYRQLVLQ